MARNVITLYWDENGKPERMIDKICRKLLNDNIISPMDHWIIEKDITNEPCGAFVHVRGNKIIVNLLSRLTNLGKGKPVELRVNDDGDFISAKEL